jgi:hypothetical protein
MVLEVEAQVLYLSSYRKNQEAMNLGIRNKVMALSIIILLTTLFFTCTSFAQTAGQGWITDYQIEDTKTNMLLIKGDLSTGVNTTYAPVLPGAEIKVTFTVNVFTAGSGNLRLATSLQKTLQDRYWELVTQDYALGSAFNPNAQSAEFNWNEGTFTISVYGKVPVSATDKPVDVNVVSLYGPAGGTPLAQIRVPMVTAKMNEYQMLLEQKETKLQSLIASGVAPGYIQIYANVLNQSKIIAGQGSVDSAIALLNSLDVTNEPVSSIMEMIFLPAIGVLAALAVIFVILFFRVKGRMSYFQLVVEDQIKDLEGLTLRASKIDRAMSSNLDSVKDRLKRLVGM